MEMKNSKIWEMLSRYKRRALSVIAPEYNTKRLYKSNFGKKLDFDNPIDINAKLQYLKLYAYYRNDVITQCVDKYRIREYLKSKGGWMDFFFLNYMEFMTRQK